MLCPAVYPPDPTLGITDPQMLPSPKRVRRSRNYAHRPCPECGKACPRDRVRTRTLHDLGDPMGDRPREIHLTYSQHHCTRCRHSFPADMSDLAAPRALYTHRVVALAVRLVVEDGLPSQTARWHLWRDHRVFVPLADPAWTSLLTNPNFPEYSSGHSSYSMAAATVLDSFFGDNVTFTTTEPTTTLSLTYTSFDQAAQDAGMSRLYGGIHFLFSIQDGWTIGQDVANWDLATFNVTKDTTPPKVTLANVLPSGASNTNVTITGQATDNLSGVANLEVQVDTGAYAPLAFDPTTGVFSFTTSFALDGSADGSHTINFQATDAAGNAASPVAFTFTLDTQAPILVVTSPTNGGTLAAGATLTGTATTNGAALVALTSSAKTSRTPKKQGEGPLFCASESGFPWETQPFSLRLEPGKLARCTEKPPNLLGKQQAPSRRTEVLAELLSYAFDGGPSMPVAFNADGSFSQALDLSKLTPGDPTLVVTAQDAAGNTTSQTLNLTLPTAIPLTITSITTSAESSDVGVTFRPEVFFSRPIDPTTLNSSNFYATDTTGTLIPATIVPSDDGLSAWLFFTNPLPSSSIITLKVNGSTIKAADGSLLDAADSGTAGSTLTSTFTTVSVAAVPGTILSGIVADPGAGRPTEHPRRCPVRSGRRDRHCG